MTWKKSSDFMRELRDNAEYQAMIKRKEAEHSAKLVEDAARRQEIVVDINSYGFAFSSWEDLVSDGLAGNRRDELANLLVGWIDKPLSALVKPTIYEALGSLVDLDFVFDFLASRCRTESGLVRDSCANALCNNLNRRRKKKVLSLFESGQFGDAEHIIMDYCRETRPQSSDPEV